MATVATVAGAIALGASAQEARWPSKPVTLVVPYPPGGTADNLARLVSKGLSERLGQPVVVDNKVGAGGIVGTGTVIRAKADGYTLLLGTNAIFSTLPVVNKLDIDPLGQMDVVGGLAGYIPVLSVSRELNVKSMKELIDLAKRKPGQLSFGTNGPGSPAHLNIEFLMQATGIDLMHVPFNGSNPALMGVLGGQIDVMVDGLTVPSAKAGRLVPLAAFYKSRHPSLPDVPTLAEAGVNAHLSTGSFGVFAPKGLPASITQTLQQALQGVTNEPAVKARAEELSLLSEWTLGADYRKVLAGELAFNRDFLHKLGLAAKH